LESDFNAELLVVFHFKNPILVILLPEIKLNRFQQVLNPNSEIEKIRLSCQTPVIPQKIWRALTGIFFRSFLSHKFRANT